MGASGRLAGVKWPFTRVLNRQHRGNDQHFAQAAKLLARQQHPPDFRIDRDARQRLAQLSHEAQLNISVWTVNDIERAKILRDQGIQGLITDFPGLMQQQLK